MLYFRWGLGAIAVKVHGEIVVALLEEEATESALTREPDGFVCSRKTRILNPSILRMFRFLGRVVSVIRYY